MYTSRFWTSHGFPGFEPTVELMLPVVDLDFEGAGWEIETRDFADTKAFKGWSGGPLWGRITNEGPYVIGVMSGSEVEFENPFYFPEWQVFAGGPAMVDLVKQAYTNWGNVQVAGPS
jgi:hypothetical protein